MRYVFENENALELYFLIIKERGIKMTPGDGFEDEVYISESFMMECMKDIEKIRLAKQGNG